MKYSEIKEIRQMCEDQGVDVKALNELRQKGEYMHIYYIGYYAPSGANWAYKCYIEGINGGLYCTVEQFGQIVAAYKLYAYEAWAEKEGK